MKKILSILLFFVCISLSGATYYVATSGSNGNPGTIGSPWATWQWGFDHINAGDVLYIRGGTYTPSGTSGGGFYNAVYVSKDGTAGSPYTVSAYGTEVPILDCSNITNSGYTHNGIYLDGADYWHLTGLTVIYAQQYAAHMWGIGIRLNGSSNCTIEKCNAHHNQGPGFMTRGYCNEALFLNCDSYYNYDPLTTGPIGDDADGWDIGNWTGSILPIIRLTGCRAWDNSDDGFDMYQGTGASSIYYLTNCWAWKNGWVPGTSTTAGNGNGFKYGQDFTDAYGTVKRYTYNCISSNNRVRGFTQEDGVVTKYFYNNIAYANGSWGFSFYSQDVSTDRLINNIAYYNANTVNEDITPSPPGSRTSTTNSWDDIPAHITNADFVSVNYLQLANTRQPGGSLPVITFLHPATGSDIIGKGTNTGQTLDGDGVAWLSPRSLGAFETATAPPTYTGPVWYIAQSGSNSNDGSSAHPWATLAYACAHVSTTGHSIYVKSGTITETAQSVLTKKVSIIGEGPTSIIHSHYNGTLIVGTDADNTDATQSISYVRFTCDYASYPLSRAITITGRSNVSIHHCEIEDFCIDGVTFQGNSYGQPTTYCLNNKFYSNILKNCASVNTVPDPDESYGNLRIGGQSNLDIYDNVIDQTTRRIVGARGFGVKFTQAGYLKDLEFYGNTVTVPPLSTGTWDFACEFWNMRGGIDIHDNYFQGTLDFGCNNSSGQFYIALNDAGGYGFALRFYNNTCEQPTVQSWEESGIDMERNVTGGVYIFNNYFHNLRYPMRSSFATAAEKQEDVYIYYNIINNVGGTGIGMMFPYSTYTSIAEDWYIWNNVIYDGSSGTSRSAIRWRFTTSTDVFIQNNILMGFEAYPIHLWGGTITNLTVSNNIAYGNGSNTLYNEGTTLVTPSVSAFIVDNPDFISAGSDFQLLAGSPAIDAGVNVGLSYDYSEMEVDDPPEIGAYQYGAKASTIPDVTTTVITAITATTATGGGNVTDDGGEAVTARGMCWSTAMNPTTSNNKTTDGSGTGVFVSGLTSLESGFTYYVRAYATNSIGTAYGSQQVFTASATPPTGTTHFVTNGSGGVHYKVTSNGKFIRSK